MGISYQGRDIQKQSEVGLRLEDLVSYDYSAYDTGSGEGAVEVIDRWLIADDLQYSSSVEFDKESGEPYSASYFLPTAINISGAFYGPLYGTATSASYVLSASYAPLSIDTSSFYVSSPSNILFANTYLLIAKGDGTTDTIDLTSLIPSTASYVLSASYAANGGVTQLLAGANISLSPTTGVGQVTISSTAGGGGGFNTATGSYGSFYSTQTQTNVASTARSMSLNTTDISNGVSVSGSTNPFNTYIKVENAGVYDIQFSAQVDKTDSGTDEIWIWIRKNGTNLTDTATSIQLQGNGAHYVAAWNFFVNAAAGDYFQLMWYSPDANVRLHAESAFGVVPGIPSLIVTANRVDQFLSNTGSFSGSFNGLFTGSLFGTASYATQALSASWAPSVASNPFPFTGSALITGSLVITGSLKVGVPGTNAATIDTAVGTLGKGSGISVDWVNRLLANSSLSAYTVDWENTVLNDSINITSIDWNSRALYDTTTAASIDWEGRLIITPGGYNALDYSNDVYSDSNLYHNNVVGTAIQDVVADNAYYAGQIIEGVIDGAVSNFDLVSLDIDGIWKGVKATVGYRADKMLGICVSVGKSLVLIEGDVGVSDDDTQGPYVAGADHGLPVYVSTTTSEMTTTTPSGASSVVRVVGHIYYQSPNDANLWIMKFRPSNDWYEI